MARLDPSLADPTPTGAVAERADCYRIAVALMRGADILIEAEPSDVLDLSYYLYSGSDR